MAKVAILTDSTCDLSQELIKKYDLHVLPLYVTFDGKSYKDFVEMTAKDMYEKAETEKIHPKTAAASVQDYYDFIIDFLKNDYEVVYCGIGKNLSSSYQNVFLVKSMIEENHSEFEDKIHLVDSMSLSTGISLTLFKMCEARDLGKSASEIAEIGNNINKKVIAQFCVEGLDYIHKGGRCSNSAKFFGTLLQIKPMLKVEEGKLNVWKKSIGSFKKALNIMIEEFKQSLPDIDKDYLFVTHSEGEKYAEYILKEIAEEVKGFKNVYVTKAGCVISSHCGKNTIGILYIKNE